MPKTGESELNWDAVCKNMNVFSNKKDRDDFQL